MTISVIVADDHAMFRQGLVPLLEEEQGVELLAQCGTGREAWALIESSRPDVAILDIRMPDLTGIEVSRRTMDAGLPTRVVLLTMHDDPSAALEALEAGAAGYILKENSFEELLIAIRTVHAGGSFITPSIQEKLRNIHNNGRTPALLSNREREVMQQLALGKSSKEIARALELSPRTVDTYRARIMDKLDLHTLADLVRYAMRMGIVA